MAHSKSFTGRTRRRTTRRGVAIADSLARVLITAGGIGTMVAVLGVCLFLIYVVVPLFQPAEVGAPKGLSGVRDSRAPIHVAIDEYQTLGWTLLADGTARSFRIDTGEVLSEKRVFEDRGITCGAFPVQEILGVVGSEDGAIHLLRCRFVQSFLAADDVPQAVREELAATPRGSAATLGEGIVQLTPEGQYRAQSLETALVVSHKLQERPIQLVGIAVRSGGVLVCAAADSEKGPRLRASAAEEAEDFLTGEKTYRFGEPIDLPLGEPAAEMPRHLAAGGAGRNVFVAWESGWLARIDCTDLRDPFVAEQGRLFPVGATLTALGFVVGDNTLVWGDSQGAVRGGFLVRRAELIGQGLYEAIRDEGRSQHAFAVAKCLAQAGTPLVSLAPSGRSRLIACGFADGEVRAFNVTSEATLATIKLPYSEAVTAIAVAPKEDGLLAFTPTRAYHSVLNTKHPEASLRALFCPIWYEGYSQPQHMWQSSSMEDEAEPKFGLMPMVFGTIKATLYAMLFGGPVALLAAVYSSEFLHPRTKAWVKPTVELMASLPSVVLGFLGALVFAPFVQRILPSTLALFASVPFSILLAAFIWQVAPGEFTRKRERWRLFLLVAPLALAVGLALAAGPALERLAFGGDIQDWLSWTPESGNDAFRSSTGGWLLLIAPISIAVTACIAFRFITPAVRAKAASLRRTGLAAVEFAQFCGMVIATILLALLLAAVLDRLGLDPRGTWAFWSTDWLPIDTYVQRNALIVGFVMGFAIIPIIYTIADDALTAVPEHLRSASLGAGATPWQTAVRIVIPTAMSGLFSAVMVGLGRAAGETMIVLMALGNTAIMDWNAFNGARTLSANIAVELPEAVQHSTHYRILFLTALVLFAMTFVVNTIAEVVRLRFRKRSYQL